MVHSEWSINGSYFIFSFVICYYYLLKNKSDKNLCQVLPLKIQEEYFYRLYILFCVFNLKAIEMQMLDRSPIAFLKPKASGANTWSRKLYLVIVL